MKLSPPKYPLHLLRWFCREDYLDEIEGDLLELFEKRAEKSPGRAKWRFWWDVVKSLRLRNMKQPGFLRHRAMFVYNPRQTVRMLTIHSAHTVSNITGLTVGLLATFFLFFYVLDETNTDSFHKDGDRIFRVIGASFLNGDSYCSAATPGPLAQALTSDFSQTVSASCRVMYDDILLSYGDKKFIERKVIFADPYFFNFFSFPLSEGLPDEVLKQPNAIVLSKEAAVKYFGDENPVGKTMLVSNRQSFVVSGILADPAGRSHLDFDIVLPISFYGSSKWMTDWHFNGLFTYVKLESPEASSYVSSRLDQFTSKYFGDRSSEGPSQFELVLEPLSAVYYNSQTRFDQAKHGDIKTVLFLGAVGIGIFFIVGFNYVNLSIAQSMKRAKELSIRRILGGDKLRLVLQFLGESFITTFVSVSLTIALAVLTLPWLNDISGLDIRMLWGHPSVYWFATGVFLFLLLISCISPALLPNVTSTIRGVSGSPIRKSMAWQLRKGLVAAQFVISISVISLTMVVYWQIRYVSEKDLGFFRDAVVLLDTNRELGPNKSGFVNQLAGSTSIEAISYSSGEPGRAHEVTSLEIGGLNRGLRVRSVIVDASYLDVFGINLIAGRSFSRAFGSEEEKGVILNEEALEQLGLRAEEALGKLVTLPERGDLKRRIIGIVSNYHFASLRDSIEPLALVQGEANWRIAIKVKPDRLHEGMSAIVSAFDQYSPGYPIAYRFLDESLDMLYAREQQESRLFIGFAGVSIFLACLGILGLVVSAVQERSKEFAIRKVVGASVGSILKLVSRDFMLLIAIAFAIALPLSWHFASGWLDGFTYRIQQVEEVSLILASGILTATIVLAAILSVAYKVTASNPIKSLRYE
ncbi:ABC transporter permease [Imperialibacter roseus]|uniref:ABC transporter permease n=1 Tax=Imperialibacter roseus TaxID=1324217 RepID=A0ABZ0IUA9_9BACT|nr:ABC transporter permease [Imperialibacter roseus]WOK07540.1 ABC transporter permease [Imperialibacter roseus]